MKVFKEIDNIKVKKNKKNGLKQIKKALKRQNQIKLVVTILL